MNKLQRLGFLLSMLVVAAVASAYTIKDTLNPVSIYTGSNTTPTINAATNGTVTMGPALSAAATPTTFNIRANGGNQALARFTASTGGALPSLVLSPGVTNALSLTSDGTNNIGALSYVNEFRFYADTFANVSGNTLYNTQVGNITSGGAWSLGPATANVVHEINGTIGFQGSVPNASHGNLSSRRVSTLTATNVTILTSGSQGVLLAMNTSTGDNCQFNLRGGIAVQEASDVSNVCGVTDGGAFPLNVFINAPNIQVDGNSSHNFLFVFTGINASNL